MDAQVTLRDANINDIEAILLMIRELAEFEQKDADALKLKSSSLIKYGYSNKPYFWIIVAADQQGTLIGYALYYYTFRPSEGAPILYLEDLYVRKAHRGQGIGSKLMSTLANKTLSEECAYMEWNVFSWNKNAIAFYTDELKAECRADLVPIRLVGNNLKELADHK